MKKRQLLKVLQNNNLKLNQSELKRLLEEYDVPIVDHNVDIVDFIAKLLQERIK
ncbi:hypothetical protein AAEX28_07175 [Lentisphaerota bacterium WC36G]|nr:hypothetical protein LJT99_10040 [Lentisphaerae bacterium WC36]